MNTTDTTQALLTATVYQSLLQHSWLKNDLSGAIDLEQAGQMLRGDFELCYSEPIQHKAIASILSIALDSVDWQGIAQSLMQRWHIPFPAQKSRTRQRQLEHHELMDWVESAHTAEEMQERAEHANAGYPVFVTEEVVD